MNDPIPKSTAPFIVACALASGACSAKVATSNEAVPPSDITYAQDAAVGRPCTGQLYYPDDGGYVACIDGAWVFEDASWTIPSGYTFDDQLEDTLLPDGYTIGPPCDGSIYFEYTSGYLACVKGIWTYEIPGWTIPKGFAAFNPKTGFVTH